MPETNTLIALRAEYETLKGYKVFGPLADMSQKETEGYISNLRIWLADLKADIREAKATILTLRTEYEAIKGPIAFTFLPVDTMSLEAANSHIARLRSMIAGRTIRTHSPIL
jgi:iron uptake system EfeUOB component EfeO/EfeM